MGMHAANLEHSPRLKRMLRALRGGWHSTMELCRAVDSCAVHSDVAELRANGIGIETFSHVNSNGRRVWYYRIEKQLAKGAA